MSFIKETILKQTKTRSDKKWKRLKLNYYIIRATLCIRNLSQIIPPRQGKFGDFAFSSHERRRQGQRFVNFVTWFWGFCRIAVQR